MRKVLREGGADEVEHILPDKFVSDAPDQLASRPDKFVHADAAANTQVPDAYVKVAEVRGPADATAPPRTARAPVPGAQASAGAAVTQRSAAVLPESQAQALGLASESSQASTLAIASAASVMPAPDMPEMDFPARVVHLRIENELLQKRLDELDKDT